MIYASPYLHPLAGYSDNLRLADLDRNGVAEVLVGTYVGAAVIETPMIQVFADGFESGDTSAWTTGLP